MGLDSPLNALGVAMLVLGLAGSALFTGRAARSLISQDSGRIIFLLRLLGAAGMGALVLRPFFEENRPDPDSFQVAILADVSGSMQTREGQDQISRLERLRRVMDVSQPEGWLSRLQEQYSVSRYAFDEALHPLTYAVWSARTSRRKTALGSALIDLLEEQDRNQNQALGAVIVLTDGHANSGIDVFEAASVYRKRGIPINTVGVGARPPEGDLSIRFREKKVNAVQGESTNFELIVTNTLAQAVQTGVSLLQGSETLQSQPISVPAGGQGSVFFKRTHSETGLSTFRASLERIPNDEIPATDIDYVQVKVDPPRTLRVLFLSSSVQNQHRFISRVLQKTDQFELDSIIQVAPERFVNRGQELPEALPEDARFWLGYHVVIVTTDTLHHLEPPAIEGLKQFVNRRGGGLLLLGNPEPARQLLGGVMPVKQVTEIRPRENRYLKIIPEPIFNENIAEDSALETALYLPGKLRSRVVSGSNRAVREGAITRAKGEPVLIAQAYGAGRTAYWGTEHDWIWNMESGKGGKVHARFWTSLLTWLGSGSSDRIEVLVGDELHPAEEPVDLDIYVSGRDYLPATDALVEATILRSDGQEDTLQLYPSSTEMGRYRAVYQAPAKGTYHVRYDIAFSEEEHLQQETQFALAFSREENLDTRFSEPTLKDLSRVTNGNYASIDAIFDGGGIALSENLPVISAIHAITENGLFMAVFALLIGGEWILRRRSGLS